MTFYDASIPYLFMQHSFRILNLFYYFELSIHDCGVIVYTFHIQMENYSVHLCMCKSVCLSVYLYVKTKGQCWLFFSVVIHLIFCDKVSQLIRKLLIETNLLASKPQGSSRLHFPSSRWQELDAASSFCHGCLRCKLKSSYFEISL